MTELPPPPQRRPLLSFRTRVRQNWLALLAGGVVFVLGIELTLASVRPRLRHLVGRRLSPTGFV
ncbi:amino acid ABC transporter permease, partial [Pseudomonas oryzihabitans]